MIRSRISTYAVTLALVALSGSALAFTRDSLVWQKCTPCHAAAADGRIARVEEVRTTPEEWTVIVDRMRRLYGMEIKSGEMDTLLKELCATQILAPDEQTKVAYLSLWHNSQQMETPVGKDDEKMFTTCIRCHSAGKVYSYRMTPTNWAKLRDFHLYVVPTVVFQMREMRWLTEADAVLAYLATRQPYGGAWSAPQPKLAGAWRMFGYEPGRGAYRGEASITDAGNGEYKLAGKLAYADGTSESFAGDGTLYGGYALRTRTTNNGFAGRGAYIVSGDEIVGETHLPAPDFHTSRVRWLRSGDAPKVARVVPGFLLTGEKTTLVVEGVKLPDAKATDVAFAGAPVKVLAVRRLGPDALELQVTSAATRVGTAKLAIKGLDAGTVTVAPKIDGIAITPETGRARVSGGHHYPAEGVQFEAIAYAKGGGAKNDRVTLGPVPATFRLVEEKTRPDDDDILWVGAIKPNGTYLPTGDYGPNSSRNYSTENSGLVKVVAQYKHGGQTYRAEASLAVTVPDYIQRIR